MRSDASHPLRTYFLHLRVALADLMDGAMGRASFLWIFWYDVSSPGGVPGKRVSLQSETLGDLSHDPSKQHRKQRLPR